ncbi:DNA N-6-adenine-methyltransferase [Xanthomonas phage XaC1]|nr:DNA N-6-adenine-methyltransferase [Xanthomonas phage XaC1]
MDAKKKQSKTAAPKKRNLGVHFTSKSQTWNTPKDFFNKIDAEWKFEVDTACLKESALCSEYFTPETDGLGSSWDQKVCWNNPPYDDIKTWIKKCYTEYVAGATVVQLIPSRTDTKAFHEYAFEYATAICFIKGRLKFDNPTLPSWKADGSHTKSPAPFPSCLIIFDDNLTDEKMKVLQSIGTVVKKL